MYKLQLSKNNQKMSNLKPIISISDTCKLLEMSRARFYQLLYIGIFPQPLYHIRTRRPFYDIRLQQRLLEIRETGIGYNGEYILFYSPRKKDAQSVKRKNSKTTNPIYKEYVDTLNSVGLECSVKDISKAVLKLYPDGIEGAEGVVIRELFRFLKSK